MKSSLPWLRSDAREIVAGPLISTSVPSFTCPFTSNDPDLELLSMQTSSGLYATQNFFSIEANEDQLIYLCVFGKSGDVACFYVQDVSPRSSLFDHDRLFTTRLTARELKCWP